MIVLFNLNNYLGGGEVLLLRFASYLKQKQIPFTILCSADSYIKKQADKSGFPSLIWSSSCDAYYYFKQHNLLELKDTQTALSNIDGRLKFFTFSLRDCYNVIHLFSDLKNYFSLTTGVYHPDDYKYLSSLSVNALQIIKHNKKTFRLLDEQKSVIFMNQFGAKVSLGYPCSDPQRIVPIPIELKFDTVTNVIPEALPSQLNITCISRFAGFKMPAVLHYLYTAKQMPENKFTLIGHGFWLFVVEKYISFNKLRNVTLLTEVNHEQIADYILESDLGFGQGTSALEFASAGKMVVVAPYSSLRNFLMMKRYYCYGFFGVNDSHLGDESYIKMGCDKSLKEVIYSFEKVRDDLEKNFLSNIGMFDSQKVFYGLSQVILNSSSEFSRFDFSFKPNLLLKKIIKKILGIIK